jgi:hypothetical protein
MSSQRFQRMNLFQSLKRSKLLANEVSFIMAMQINISFF